MKRSPLTNILLATLLSLIASPLLATPIKPTDNTIINSDGDISGGNLSGDGANLFHSFEAFGLDTGQTANFLSTPRIHNILGRVTGGNPSIINGLIQVTGGNSNLYLINPAGIVFGANASLNVPGDFAATTATGIGFNGGWFDVFENNNYKDLTGNPTQFAFDLVRHGAIINDGNLAVNPGQNLTLLGSSIANNGTLMASDGRITIASISGQNVIRISHQNSLLSLEIESERIPENGEIKATDLAELLTGRTGETISNGSISAAKINVLGDRVFVNGSIDASRRDGGGNIRIGGGYQGSETVPNAESTYIGENATILANSLESGDGGRIIVWADDRTHFYGTIESEGGAIAGDGGFVEVSGKRHLIYEGMASTAPNSARGDYGLLFIDPANFSFSNSTAIPDLLTINALLGTSLNFGDLTYIAEEILEAQNSPVSYAATDNIIFHGFSDNELTLLSDATFTAGGSILLLDSSLTAQSLSLQAADRILSSSPTTLTTTAHLNLTATGTIAIGETESQSLNIQAGDDITTGNLQALGGNVDIDGGGDLRPGEIASNGGDINIRLDSGGLTSTHNIDTTRVGGNGGRIEIGTNRNIQANAFLTFAPDLGQDGGKILVVSWGGNIILDRIETYASHNAGSVSILAADDINIVDFSNLTGGYQGGNLYLGSDNGSIGQQTANTSTGSVGSNNGGNIFIVAPRGTASLGDLVASSANGMGGRVRVTASGIATGDILSTGPTGGGEIILRALDRNISTESLIGGEITAIAPNAIAINGTVRSSSDVTLDTGLLTISGVDPLGNSLTANQVTITSGTPFEIRGFSPGGAAGAIANLSSGIFTSSTTIGNFSFFLNNPPPTSLPSTPPQPQATTPVPETVAEQIARAFDAPFSATATETSEGENAIAYSWEGLFELWLPSPTETPPPERLSEGSAIASSTFTDKAAQLDRQLEIDFDKYFEESDLPKNPVSSATIRESLKAIEAQLGKTFAIFYVVPRDVETGETVLDLALFLPNQAPIFTVSEPFRRGEARETVKELRQAIPALNEEYFPKSRWLYDRIIAPMQVHLEGVDGIAFALGDGIRGLPIAALHDGTEFIVERHATAVIPSFSLIDARYSPAWNREVLAMGASNLPGRELPAVERELEAIAQHFPAQIILNEDFSFKETSDRIAGAEILHLATHASIATDAERSSTYIEFWDGRISAAEFRQLDLDRVALAVLSACDTGRGNFPELGFAGIAHALGVRSAIASLWQVDDDKTADFMAEFYKHLADSNAPTLAESLQQAQLEMVSDGLHPYYWSSFTAIGTPW